MTSQLKSIYDEKPAFNRAYQGELTTWEYVDYRAILVKKRMITHLFPESDLTIFPIEHPTRKDYSELVEIAIKAGLRR
jgi:hypothetical protein